MQQYIFKNLTFPQVLLIDFAETETKRVSDTCLKFTTIFRKIVIVSLGRNTPNK